MSVNVASKQASKQAKTAQVRLEVRSQRQFAIRGEVKPSKHCSNPSEQPNVPLTSETNRNCKYNNSVLLVNQTYPPREVVILDLRSLSRDWL